MALLGLRLTGRVTETAQSADDRVLIGNLGSSWRAEVGRGGRITPLDGGRSFGFAVAADDRWHDPDRDPGVRSRRIDGVAAVETRIRIPNGDLVQRVWCTASSGGVTVVEFENESPLPVVVAVDNPGILTGPAPTTSVPDEVGMPSDARALPVGHHATARIAVRHGAQQSGSLPQGLPDLSSVVAGWRSVIDRAGRYDLPAGAIGGSAAESVVAARCDWMLGDLSDPDVDPVSALIEADHLARMGEPVDELVPIVARSVERAVRRGAAGIWAGLDAAARVLVLADERRALADLDRIASGSQRDGSVPDNRAGRAIALDRRLVSAVGNECDLLPDGIPEDWMLQGFEAHGLPAGRSATVSFAVRWHGRRPAVIWECSGGPVRLSAAAVDASWESGAETGEHLWGFEAPDPAIS